MKRTNKRSQKRAYTLAKTKKAAEKFDRDLNRYLRTSSTVREAVAKAAKSSNIAEVVREEIEMQAKAELARGYQKEIPDNVATETINQRWSADMLTLSERTTHGMKEVEKKVAEIITEAIKTRDTVTELARKIYDGYRTDIKNIPSQGLPDYLREVADLTDLQNLIRHKGWHDPELAKRIRIAKRAAENNQTAALKAAYKQLIEVAERGAVDEVGKAASVAAEEQTRYFANRIARTEMARAYNAGAYERVRTDSDVVALKWRHSSRHNHYDICDFYADCDIYGMGAGVFPIEELPALPAHPHCWCHFQPVYDEDTPKPDTNPKHIDERAGKFFRGLKTWQREDILGVKGSQAYLKGRRKWQTVLRGDFNDKMRNQMGLKEAFETGASGALTNKNDPFSTKRDKHAAAYYESVKKRDKRKEIDAVARAASMSYNDVEKIYNYVFIEKHHLDTGYHRFSPDFYMANSWQRLREGKPLELDIVMLKHELIEMELVKSGKSYNEAHAIANLSANYSALVVEYEKEFHHGGRRKKKRR